MKVSIMAWLCVAAPFIMMSAPLHAAAESAAMERGHRALAAGRYEEAYAAYREASRDRATAPAASFFGAAALNRLGRPRLAPGLLERARVLGYRHRDHDFEMGWALLALGHAAEALKFLDRVPAGSPRRAKARELAGRARLRLGAYDAARADLEEARRQDPALAPGAAVALAAERKSAGDDAQARRLLEDVLDQHPGSPQGRFLASRLGPARAGAPRHARRRLRGSAGIGAGHNDNVVALGQGVPLPTDISFRRSSFLRAGATFAHDWQLGEEDTLTLGYAYLGFNYDRLAAFDLQDHTLYVSWSHPLEGRWAAGLSITGELTDIGDSQFRNQVAVRPAASYRHGDRAITEASVSFATARYLFPALAVFDRSGDATTAAVNHFRSFDGNGAQARLGAFYTRSSTRGQEFDSDTFGVSGSLVHPLDRARRTRAEVSGTAYSTEYDNPSLFGGGRRDDDGSLLGFQLAHAIADATDAWVRVDHTDSGSNIRFFDFDQTATTVGITRTF